MYADCQTRIRVLCLLDEAQESVPAFEPTQQLLDIGGVDFGDVGNDLRIELMPLDARRGKHRHFALVQPIETALDDAARRLRQIAADRIHTPCQAPLSGGLRENALFSKVFHEVGHEERISLGAPMNEVDETRFEMRLWQLQREVVRDVVQVQDARARFPGTDPVSAGRDERRGMDVASGRSPPGDT